MVKLKLMPDWGWIVRKAWSFRLIAMAAILSAIDAIMPMFMPKYPSLPLTLMALALNIAALVARLVAQRDHVERKE